jgi:hypothetical protein
MRPFIHRLLGRFRRLLRQEDLPPVPGPREIEQAVRDRASATAEEKAAAETAADAVLERLRRENGQDKRAT